MNVLLLDQFSDLGGAQQVLAELLPALLARGWRVVVGIPGDGKLFDVVRGLGVDVVRVDCWPYKSGNKLADVGRFLAHTRRLSQEIFKLASRVEADLVYVNGPRFVPAAALAGLSCPVLFHCHSWLPPDRSRTVTGMALWWMNARVVAACEFVAQPWRRYLRAERIATIFNGVAGPARMPARRPTASPRIGCIGRITPQKGQMEFVAAAARIHEMLPECRFVVCGDALFGVSKGRDYAAEVQAAAAGLPVEFRGWVTDIYGALADLDLLLVSSRDAEATPRVILEAFAAGVPVIAFDCGGICEVLKPGITGILTSSVEGMARESIALLGDPERRASMVQAARVEFERRFTLEKFHDRLLGAIEEEVKV